VTALQLFFFM